MAKEQPMQPIHPIPGSFINDHSCWAFKVLTDLLDLAYELELCSLNDLSMVGSGQAVCAARPGLLVATASGVEPTNQLILHTDP